MADLIDQAKQEIALGSRSAMGWNAASLALCSRLLDALAKSEEARETAVLAFAKAALHGDEDHKAWLLSAAEAFVAGSELPAPNGKGRAETAEASLSQALARIEELEKALEPFAAAADHYDPPEDDDKEVAWADEFTIGCLRRARAALPATPIDGGKGQ